MTTGSLKNVGSAVALHCYKNIERAGDRQNYFRQASTSDFVRWFGRKFRYSSDYICSHASEFSTSVAFLARLGNRSEEFGEMMFRAAGCASRFVGGAVPGTLRNLTGKGRFIKRLEKNLLADGLKLTDKQMKAIFGVLVKKGALSIFGLSKYDLTPQKLDRLLADLYNIQPDEGGLAGIQASQKTSLHKAIIKADMRRLVSQRSFATKVALTVGCAAIALAYFAVYTALKGFELGLASSFFIKFGMVSALAYTLGFVFRSAATILARATQAHNGTYTSPENKKNYLSLFDHSAKFLRDFRNDNPITGKKLGALAKAYKEKDDEHEACSMALLAEDKSSWVRCPAKLSKGLDVATDIMFSLDRVIGQGISRSTQRFLFRYENNVKHEVGISAGGKCKYSWKFKKGDGIRRALASFVGRGGADCLGMAIGCASCSAAWTALNLALPAGVMFPVAAIGGASGGLALGFASVAAIGWGSSAVIDAGVQLGRKVAQLKEAEKMQINAVLDQHSNSNAAP